jgi:hypothetical protein
VFAVDPATQTVRKQSVDMVRVLDSTIVLDGGLSADATVVTAGMNRLRDGDPVRAVHEDK